MSGWWQAVMSRAASSRSSLLYFGAQMTIGTLALGYAFSYLTAPSTNPDERRKQVAGMDYNSQRFATAQQQRLTGMLQDMVAGQGDKHWDAAMKGTLQPHPHPENKSFQADNEPLARR